MADNNAGTVYAEIRIALENLQKDINKTSAMFKQVETAATNTSNQTTSKFDVMGKNINKSIEGLSNGAASQFAKMMSGMQKAIMAAPIVGALLMMVGTVKKIFSGVTNWINETSQAYIEQEQSIAKMNAVLQNTGAIAWTSTRQLQDQARSLASITGQTTKGIIDVQTQLLSYPTITGKMFERAVKGAVDAAAVLGGEATGFVNQLAVAIENPIRGMTSLSKQGFIFDQQTKELTKSLMEQGKLMEAQEIIMSVWEESYGGAAQAANDVNAAMSRLETATERLKIAQGEATTGIRSWWANIRADWKEARADAAELKNAIADAFAGDYTQEADQIGSIAERLNAARKELAELEAAGRQEMTIELEIDIQNARDTIKTLEHQRIKADLELNRKMATDELIKAEQELKYYFGTAAQGQAGYNMMLDEEYLKRKENIEALREKIGLIEEEIDVASDAASRHMADMAAEDAEMQQLNEMREKRIELEQQLIDKLEEINRAELEGLVTAEEATRLRQAAHKAEADGLNSLITLTNNLALNTVRAKEEQKRLVDEVLGPGLTNATQNYQRFTASVNNASNRSARLTGRAFAQARDEIIQTFRDIEAWENAQVARGQKSREDADKEILASRERMVNGIQQLLLKNQYFEESQAPETFRILQQHLDIIGTTMEELGKKRGAEFIEEMQGDLKRLGMSTRQLREETNRLELAELQRHESYMGATEEQQKEMEELLKKAQKMRDNPFKNWQSGIQELSKYSAQAIQAVGAVFAAVAAHRVKDTEELIAKLEKDYEETRRIKDQEYADLMEDIDKRHQAALYEAGLISGVTEEQIALDLERAKQTGNERLMLETKNKLKQKQIDDKFKAEQKAAEEKKKKEDEEREKAKNQRKAELEYEAAMATYNQSIIQAALNAAMAIGSALAMGWPTGLIMAPIAGTMGAAQVVAAKAAKPKLQTFAHGGIVAGNSFSGDSNLVRANSGERLVTQKQQERMTDILDGKSTPGQNIVITIPLHLDSRIVTEEVIRLINNGEYQIVGDRAIV